MLKQGSDHAQLSEELWRFFVDIYGGGPEIILKSPSTADQEPETTRRLTRKYSESDREEYCNKSNSEINIRETIHSEVRNQSLQDIHRRYKAQNDYRQQNGFGSDEDTGYVNGLDSSDTNLYKTDSELPNVTKRGSKVRRNKRRSRRPNSVSRCN